mmetsp:Transcript_134358/g.268155  ORF Transcript_134358/g.268155 Transcript_134358/m.268155 type:complete len:222 (-) Transcript_134358:1298-1963(-)
MLFQRSSAHGPLTLLLFLLRGRPQAPLWGNVCLLFNEASFCGTVVTFGGQAGIKPWRPFCIVFPGGTHCILAGALPQLLNHRSVRFSLPPGPIWGAPTLAAVAAAAAAASTVPSSNIGCIVSKDNSPYLHCHISSTTIERNTHPDARWNPGHHFKHSPLTPLPVQAHLNRKIDDLTGRLREQTLVCLGALAVLTHWCEPLFHLSSDSCRNPWQGSVEVLFL